MRGFHQRGSSILDRVKAERVSKKMKISREDDIPGNKRS
jgi:hypothetical protein